MGNTEILTRGDIQLTSAGLGIKHSEKAHGPNPGTQLKTPFIFIGTKLCISPFFADLEHSKATSLATQILHSVSMVNSLLGSFN